MSAATEPMAVGERDRTWTGRMERAPGAGGGESAMAAGGRGASPPRRPSVALACAGLGVVHRGHEISTLRFKAALESMGGLEVELFASRGVGVGTPLFSLKRSWLWSVAKLVRLKGRRVDYCLIHGGIILEQLSFGVSLLGRLLAGKYDLVWTKELLLARFLAWVRDAAGLRFAVVWADGSGKDPRLPGGIDLVQLLSPDAFERAQQQRRRDRYFLLANCVPEYPITTPREALRAKYGYAATDWVVVCAAAFNSGHKRIDYVIDEVASVPEGRVRLALCGQEQPGSDGLKIRGTARMPGRIAWRTLSADGVRELMAAADVLVLGSLNEAFGNVLAEAALAGLPVLVHGFPAARFILGPRYVTYDFSRPGALAAALQAMIEQGFPASMLAAARRNTVANFSPAGIAREFARVVETRVVRRPGTLI